MSSAAVLSLLASLREEEEGVVEPELIAPISEPINDLHSQTLPTLEGVKILFFGPEGAEISRSDVIAYKTQLKGGVGISRSIPGVSAVIPTPQPSSRTFALSDESVGTAGLDKSALEGIVSNLVFDTQPLVRAWTLPGGNPEAMHAQYYNYGLNDKLFREYLEHQIALRVSRAQRAKLEVGGMRSSAWQGNERAGASSAPVGGDLPPQKAVYIVGFPIEWSQFELQDYFSKFAPVESAAVISKRTGLQAKGAGFVNFVDLDGAIRAVNAANGRGVPGRDDVRLCCNFAKPKTGKSAY